MQDFVSDLRAVQEANEKQQAEALWNGHSRFQTPAYILGYQGEAEALVLLYLYQRATYVNLNAEREGELEILVKEELIAHKCGLSRQTVSYVICKLEADWRIRVRRTIHPITKEKQTSIYLLLHSATKLPMKTSPGDYGVCYSNFERPFITVPAESFDVLPRMGRPARAVYLAALAIGSTKMRTLFGVTRTDWKKESLLERRAFNSGVNECLRRKLLTFKKGMLRLNDPETGAPSARTAPDRVEHGKDSWKFKFDDVSAETWRATIGRLVKTPFIIDDVSGWSRATRGSFCPFCGEEKCFTLSFATGSYQCFACKRMGGLAMLLLKLLGTTRMPKVIAYIKEQMPRQEPAPAPEPVVTHAGI
jgi:hypothetical protein